MRRNPAYDLVDGHKTCTDCQLHKPIAAYSKSTRSRTGHMFKCKECCNMYAIGDYARNKAARAETKRKLIALDPEKHKLRQAAYYAKYQAKRGLMLRAVKPVKIKPVIELEVPITTLTTWVGGNPFQRSKV